MHRDLFDLLRAYAALLPPPQIQFPAHLPLQLVHDFLLDELLLGEHFRVYPPSAQYQKAFWKWVLGQLETSHVQADDEFEIDSRVYEHYLGLLNAPDGASASENAGPPSQSYITQFWRMIRNPAAGDEDIDLGTYERTTLLESRTMIEAGTTGMRTWLASLVLAEYLIRNPDLVEGKRILELGSGIGFLGAIVASLQLQRSSAGAGALWLSDVNESVLERCRDNLRLPCNRSSLTSQPVTPTLEGNPSVTVWADSNQIDSLVISAISEPPPPAAAL